MPQAYAARAVRPSIVWCGSGRGARIAKIAAVTTLSIVAIGWPRMAATGWLRGAWRFTTTALTRRQASNRLRRIFHRLRHLLLWLHWVRLLWLKRATGSVRIRRDAKVCGAHAS